MKYYCKDCGRIVDIDDYDVCPFCKECALEEMSEEEVEIYESGYDWGESDRIRLINHRVKTLEKYIDFSKLTGADAFKIMQEVINSGKNVSELVRVYRNKQ